MERINQNQHAFIIEGERQSSIEALKEILESEWGVKIKGNPDIREAYFETFAIDDARKIKESAYNKPFGEKNIFIIAANFIGHEAQNALLKVLEEPIPNTYFFLVVQNAESLLPTVRSRSVVVRHVRHRVSNKTVFNKMGNLSLLELEEKFLKANVEERLKILGSFLSHESESKKSDLLTFLNSLEKIITIQKNRTKEMNEGLSELLEFKKYLFDRSPSIKMIGEYLALRLPKI